MRILCTILIVFTLLTLLGCDGESYHDVTPGTDGSLYGMVIYPEPQSLNVDVDEAFYLEWEDGTTPPEEFTFMLEQVDPDGTTEAVPTVLTELSLTRYRFDPVYLSSQTFLLLSVYGGGESERAMYLVNGLFRETQQKTDTPATGEAKTKHVITTRTDDAGID